MKFGSCIPTASYGDLVSIGYEFAEFSGSEISAMSGEAFEKLVKTVADGPIPVIGFNAYCPGEPAIVGDKFDPAKVRSYAELMCRRGKALGIRALGIGAPLARKLPEGYDMELARKQCVSFLRITAEVAEPYGISVNFEALHDHACDFCNTTKEACDIVREAGMPNIALVLDFYHRYGVGENLTDYADCADLIRHTHISTCGPNYERGYPKMDELNTYRGIIDSLKAIGYNDTLSVEAGNGELLTVGPETLQMLKLADRQS